MLRPRQVIEDFGRQLPGAWDALAALRAERAGDWPGYVFAPMDAGALALLTTLGRRPELRQAVMLPGLAAWRVTQQVFRFDPDLYRALISTPITGDIPGAMLHRLPAWCVYVETPGMELPIRGGGMAGIVGVFAWLDWDAGRGDQLCLGYDTGTSVGVAHLGLAGTLAAGIDAVAAEWATGTRAGLVSAVPAGFREACLAHFPPVLSLLLYLCADDPDYCRPTWPTPRRIKGRERLVPPDRPDVVPVGERIGAALRRAAVRPADPDPGAAGDGGRQSPVPHVRRAHWHTFLSGPRDVERRRELRWLPPVGVRLDLGAELAATVRPVK